jgi:hypothetical protein
MTKTYEASPTVARLMTEYQGFKVSTLLGPIGGGKTTGIIMTLLTVMNNQRPDLNGCRRTRFAVVRNTRQQLKDSVIKSVHAWLPPNGSSIVWRETDMTQVFTYRLEDGTQVRSEWMFRSLDDEDDARKLLSVEYTAGWLSEFREIPLQLLTDLRSRMGRFPAVVDGGCSWSGVLAESNMPIEGSEWHQLLEVDRPSWLNPLIQPPGMLWDDKNQKYVLNPMAENVKWLEPGYYENLTEGATKYWMQSMILCEYPPSLDGKAVYAGSFDRARHVSSTPLASWQFGDFSPSLVIGVDQGRNPAAIITQLQPRGTLYALRELWGVNMGMDRFVDEILRPALAVRDFVGLPVLIVIDPAGFQKSQINDLSPADILKQKGFKVIPAPTNDPARRIDAVERLMQRNDGLQIDPSCKELIRGLSSEYKFKSKKNGELEDRPEKKHPISDLQDALQYAALIAGGVNTGRLLRGSVKRTQTRPSVASWS